MANENGKESDATMAIGQVIKAFVPFTKPVKQEEETYECPACFDTGFVDRRDKYGRTISEPCRICDKNRKDRIRRLLEKARLPYHKMDVKPNAETLDFLRDFDANKPIWMLFTGKAGGGKTTEAAWLAYELITKKFVSVRFYSGYDLVIDLNATRKRPDEHEKILDDIHEADLVVIDDLFKSLPAPNSYRYADYMEACYEAIWARYNVRKPLVITTQFPLEALIKVDAALAGRIAELSRGRIVGYGREAKNWRLVQ